MLSTRLQLFESEMNKIALSFDIEDWYYAAAVSGSSISQYSGVKDFLADNEEMVVDCITEETKRILNILQKYDVKATFFVVADVARQYPKIAECLKQSPHEIASHSLTHLSAFNSASKQPLKNPEEWKSDQREAKLLLESIFEREVEGFRAPNAYFATWMVQPLIDLGFKYDSSIAYNSLYNKTDVKLKAVPTHPYLINSSNLGSRNPNSKLVELPWSYYNIFNAVRLPAGGAFFFRVLGSGYFMAVLKQALRKGDTMFYLHPLDITNKRIPITNWSKRPAYWWNKGSRTEIRLIKLLQTYGGRFTTCLDVYRRFIEGQ